MLMMRKYTVFVSAITVLLIGLSCDVKQEKVQKEEAEQLDVYVPPVVEETNHPTPPLEPEPKQLDSVKQEEQKKTLLQEQTRNLTIRLEMPENQLLAPVRLMLLDKELAVIKSPVATVSIPVIVDGQLLSLKTPYYQPLPDFTLQNTQKELSISLTPLLVRLQVSDTLAMHKENLDGVLVYYDGQVVAKTIKNGLAEVNIANLGKNEFSFFKPHVFHRQDKILNIQDISRIYTIQLFPLKHFVKVKLVNESGRLLKDRNVEITGEGVAMSGTSNANGIVTFENYRLKPGVSYILNFPNLGIEQIPLQFNESQWDAQNAPVLVKVPELYPWVITATTAGTELTIYNSLGKQVAESTDRLEIKLKAGTYKIKAKTSEAEKEDIINASAKMRTKTMIMEDCYEMAKKWKSNHPKESIPSDIITCMKNTPTSDPNFINSRMMLAKETMEQKQFAAAQRYYMDIFEYDRSKRFNPVVLCNAAQANIFLADNYQDTRKEQLLNSSLTEYLDYVPAYINKIPMKSRKRWLIKAKYLQGEVYQRLFFYYQPQASRRGSAKENQTKAIDALRQFTRDYQALQSGDPLKNDMRMDYERANDLIAALIATPI